MQGHKQRALVSVLCNGVFEPICHLIGWLLQFCWCGATVAAMLIRLSAHVLSLWE